VSRAWRPVGAVAISFYSSSKKKLGREAGSHGSVKVLVDSSFRASKRGRGPLLKEGENATKGNWDEVTPHNTNTHLQVV